MPESDRERREMDCDEDADAREEAAQRGRPLGRQRWPRVPAQSPRGDCDRAIPGACVRCERAP